MALNCVFLVQVKNRFHAMAIITRVVSDAESGLYPFSDFDQSKVSLDDIIAAYCDDKPLEYPPLKRTGFDDPESCRGGLYDRSLRDPLHPYHYISYNDDKSVLEFHDGCKYNLNAGWQSTVFTYLNGLGGEAAAIAIGDSCLCSDSEMSTTTRFGRSDIRAEDLQIYEEHIRKYRKREQMSRELVRRQYQCFSMGEPLCGH